MDESFRKAVIAAAVHANPSISRSCPLANLADVLLKTPRGSTEEARRLVQRFVSYSQAPPAMMHVNQILLYTNPPTDHESSSQSSKFDVAQFVSFFTSKSIGNTSAAPQNVPDEEISQKPSSVESKVDDILRDVFLEAAEELEDQFCSLSTSLDELIVQIEATAKACSAGQSSVDQALIKAIEAARVRMEQSNSNSCFKFLECIVTTIDEASMNSEMKIALAKRIIFSCIPHPEESSGNEILLKCLWDAILRVELVLHVDTPVEALTAAMERLPAVGTVKLLLRQAIIEASRRNWKPKDNIQAANPALVEFLPVVNGVQSSNPIGASSVDACVLPIRKKKRKDYIRAIGMKTKFKVQGAPNKHNFGSATTKRN